MPTILILILVFTIISLFVYISLKREDKKVDKNAISIWKNILRGSFALFLVLTFICSIGIVPAGHIGVINFFGSVSKNELTAGPNIKNPFARLITLSIRTIELKDSLSVPSKEGLTQETRYINPLSSRSSKASQLYKEKGRSMNQLLFILSRSITREVTSS